jgi:hypothetical protein
MTNTISRDGDMIRRGDAIAALRQARWDISREEFVQAVRALPAVQPRVKPLVWMPFGKEFLRAESVLGRYELMWGFENGKTMLDAPGLSRRLTWHRNPQKGKEAAQAHHDEQIWSALEPQPDASAQLTEVLSDLAAGQRRLGAEFEDALAENRAELYCEGPLPPAPDAAAIREAAMDLPDYDAGLLNDWGGGNVEWWQDYIRAEIGRTNDHWRALAALNAGKADT